MRIKNLVGEGAGLYTLDLTRFFYLGPCEYDGSP